MTNPAYLPDDLAAQLLYELPETTDTATRWAIERAAETAYARGYADGHLRGHRFGREAEARDRRAADRLAPAAEPEPVEAGAHALPDDGPPAGPAMSALEAPTWEPQS